ncbi:MAG TPA: NYN domain-containing protein [Gemmatimonadaceae bacterium]|nr:NYN domain-containing protein [Gemmatimonadaceae bacterium]
MHRGPQAHPTPASSPAVGFPPPYGGFAHHAPNAALLIDFDNVTMGIRSDLGNELRNLLGSDIIKGKVAVQRAYADWRRYPQYIVPLTESSIDMIFAPAYGSSKKNATDIRLAVDAMELVFTRPEIGTYILLSGDSDFSSLVLKLKEYGKYVIGVGIRESSSDLLVMNCDEYYSYNALAGLVKSSDEEEAQTSHDPWELVSEAIQRMQRNGDVMRSDRLKQVMQEIDPSFDEGDLGFSKFSKFTMEAAHKGLVNVTRLENGQLEVAPPSGGRPAAADGTGAPAGRAAAAGSAAAPAGRAAATPTDGPRGRGERPDREAPNGEEERGRSRRGRRGRGRGRDTREERGDEAAAIDREAAEVSAVGDEAGNGVPAPRRDQPVERFAATEGIGGSGERLTRDEAFALVRRAVESLTSDEDDAVSAAAVRERARDLLGRDSESLSDRMFTRILRDAHDADVIDLRRRGDDFEVARAAGEPTVREQLDRAEAAATPTAPASTGAAFSAAASARRGMGPRGITGRGRGRPGAAPPPDLFAVGMIDEPVVLAPPVEPLTDTPEAPVPAPAEIADLADLAAAASEARTTEGAPRARRARGTAKRAAKKGAAPAAEAAADDAGESARKRPRRGAGRGRKRAAGDGGAAEGGDTE